MANRTWVIGGSVVGVAALTLMSVLLWRTAQMVGMVTGGDVDLGVDLSNVRPVQNAALADEDAAAMPAERAEGRAKPSRIGGFTPDNLRLDPTRLAVRHDARSAEELEQVRERVREKQDGMTPQERAARKDRRDARKEAIGLAGDDEPPLEAEDEVEPEAEPLEDLE